MTKAFETVQKLLPQLSNDEKVAVRGLLSSLGVSSTDVAEPKEEEPYSFFFAIHGACAGVLLYKGIKIPPYGVFRKSPRMVHLKKQAPRIMEYLTQNFPKRTRREELMILDTMMRALMRLLIQRNRSNNISEGMMWNNLGQFDVAMDSMFPGYAHNKLLAVILTRDLEPLKNRWRKGLD